MKISYVQSGGVTGTVKEFEVDTEMEPDQDAQVLESLVEKAGFFDMDIAEEKPMPDMEMHCITVESEEQKRTICVSRLKAPPELKQLISALANRAKYSSLG